MKLSRLETMMGVVWLVTAAGCGPSRPPADLAPDPGLAARIQQIRIEGQPTVCPGGRIQASYLAVLDNGSVMPFSTEYDEDDPPALHVIMLRRTSPDASPREDGSWDSNEDPLQTAVSGFRLNAFLKVKPSANGALSVAPTYECAREEFVFTGERGQAGGAGGNGPDVNVRVGILSSPFYERLLVLGLQVGVAPPEYILADADAVPPADWFRVVSRGGPGGKGQNGSEGAAGADGAVGCPGSPGGAGGAGGNGGAGGRGGRGGQITVIAPDDEPFLAGLVDARAPGGPGGKGGNGGDGGVGGKGGAAQSDTQRRCVAGAAGAAGADGEDGPDGREGPAGPFAASITVPASEIFGVRVPLGLQRLLEWGR